MNFEEHAAKALLKARGLPVPDGIVAGSPEAAADATRALGGSCVVKAQAPTGKRGKAGGIRLVDSPDQARAAAADILGMTIGGHRIERNKYASTAYDRIVWVARPAADAPLIPVRLSIETAYGTVMGHLTGYSVDGETTAPLTD